MFYCSMHIPIGFEGLNMPTDGCSVYIPIITVNSKLRGFKQGLGESIKNIYKSNGNQTHLKGNRTIKNILVKPMIKIL